MDLLEVFKQSSIIMLFYIGMFKLTEVYQGNGLLRLLGDYSFYIYLFHVVVERTFL